MKSIMIIEIKQKILMFFNKKKKIKKNHAAQVKYLRNKLFVIEIYSFENPFGRSRT